MDGLHIYITPEKLTATNERVHITFDRHFPDDMSQESGVAPEVRLLRGSDIPRLFEAINCLNTLSTRSPGNEHQGNPHNSAETELAALKADDAAQEENGRRRLARNR